MVIDINKRRLSKKNWILKNPEKFKSSVKLWQSKNKTKINKTKYKYFKKRLDTDENFRLVHRLRNRVFNAFKRLSKNGKVKPSKKYGIDYPKIMEHLMATLPEDFKEKKYHIDHIKPCCAFDLENPDEVKKCFDVSNLQWLSKEDNLHKISQDRKLSIHK